MITTFTVFGLLALIPLALSGRALVTRLKEVRGQVERELRGDGGYQESLRRTRSESQVGASS